MAVSTTAGLDRAVSMRSPATERTGSALSRRDRYAWLVRRLITDVIVDVDVDGPEDRPERAPDEMWPYAFVPSTAERTRRRRWQKAGTRPMCRPFLVGAP